METIANIELTSEGRQKLLDELEEREGTKAAEIIESLKEARGFGDLSENSEYDAAREEQAQNAARINEIRQILSMATVVDEATSKRGLKVSIGTTVELTDDKNKKLTVTLVGTTETDSINQRISTESPVGRALIGHKKGDVVEVVAPSGRVRNYTIDRITR